ncbi:MAG: DUF6687 family protein [Nannocystaceae bacterium]
MSLRFQMFGPGLDPSRTLCVDGRAFGLRSLSHWPGPPPPPPLAHDVTTGMALAYARCSEDQRRELLGEIDVVTNDHYDTDGALSLFAFLDPATALRHEDLMVRAATTGDFRTWHGEDALAVDLTVWAIRDAAGSPLRQRLDAIDDYFVASELCYEWVLEHMPQILDEPMRWSSLWQPRFDRIIQERQRLLEGGVKVERHEDLDLAVIRLLAPATRHTIVAAADDLYRVLVVHESEQGLHYRFSYRNESWFMGLRDRVPPRLHLDDTVRALDELEGDGPRWWCTPIDTTSAQLGLGSVERQTNVFDDFRPDLDPPSRLSPAQVVETLRAALGASPAREATGGQP